MKLNLPVTGQEHIYPAGMTLVSKTDTKGIITFANQDFIEVCGFSQQELVGANHNIIRHPDMPAAAFAAMWRTLKRGQPWRGIVKNRCKNGDHYWVDAKVVPIKKDGAIVGYMSVRTCPSRADVAAAEAAYQNAATAPETIKEAAIADWKKHLSIRNGIPLWILFVTLLMIAGGILGIGGMRMSSAALESLYFDEMNPVQAIGRINFLMADNRAQVALALHHNPQTHADYPHDHTVAAHLQKLADNKEEIDGLWAGYVLMNRIAGPEEKALADAYWAARNRYVAEGLLQARAAIEAGDYAQAELLLLKQVTPLYDEANARVSQLLAFLSDRGHAKYAESAARNETIARVAIAGIVASCLILIVCGGIFYRLTVMPLQKAVLALEKIAEGNLSGEVDTAGYGEPGRVVAAVQVMQMHLKVMLHEIRQSADSIYRQCRNLNTTMMNLAEHSDEQHDRVYQTLDAVGAACAGLRAMAGEAETLLGSGADTAATVDAAGSMAEATALEPMPDELLGLFGAGADLPAAAAPVDAPGAAVQAAAPVAAGDNAGRMQALANAARVQAMAVEEVAAQLKQVAALIVDNREEVQGAWAASQQLERTARELEKLIQYFE